MFIDIAISISICFICLLPVLKDQRRNGAICLPGGGLLPLRGSDSESKPVPRLPVAVCHPSANATDCGAAHFPAEQKFPKPKHVLMIGFFEQTDQPFPLPRESEELPYRRSEILRIQPG